MEHRPIYCPVCQSELIHTHDGRYQDLMEHVCDPNGTPSMKAGYQCPDESCIARKLNATWLAEGDLYMGTPEDCGFTWSGAHQHLKSNSINGAGFALNSWEHYREEGKKKIQKWKFKIHLWKFRIDVYPKDKGWEHPMEEQFNPDFFRWKFDYWKKDRDGHWIGWLSDYRMTKFCLGKFHTAYNSSLYNPNKNKMCIKECIELIDCTQWGRPDERRYAKITAWILKRFYSGRVQNIINIAKAQGIRK